MYATFFLIAVLCGGFAWENMGGDPGAAVMAAALVPYNLTHDVSLGIPVWLTPTTSLGLHAGLWHLVSNAFVLLAVGPAVERRCGTWRYLAFFGLCGIAGGLAQVLLDPESHRPIIGASGAISGLLAAYLMRDPPVRSFFGAAVAVVIFVWAGVQCFESGVLSSGGTPLVETEGTPIAYAAHVGGLVFGALTIGLFDEELRH